MLPSRSSVDVGQISRDRKCAGWRWPFCNLTGLFSGRRPFPENGLNARGGGMLLSQEGLGFERRNNAEAYPPKAFDDLSTFGRSIRLMFGCMAPSCAQLGPVAAFDWSWSTAIGWLTNLTHGKNLLRECCWDNAMSLSLHPPPLDLSVRPALLHTHPSLACPSTNPFGMVL